MQDRIRKIIQVKEISPATLADQLGVQRSNVTHILNGRNKPSFQFIEKLLQIYPDINAKWLILGDGSMLESDKNIVGNHGTMQNQLFSDNVLDDKSGIQNDTPSSSILDESNKGIEKLVVFYSDQTFKVYTPSK